MVLEERIAEMHSLLFTSGIDRNRVAVDQDDDTDDQVLFFEHRRGDGWDQV